MTPSPGSQSPRVGWLTCVNVLLDVCCLRRSAFFDLMPALTSFALPVLRIRHAEPFLSGLAVTFFWLGLTVGRVTLGFITGRVGEKLAIMVYLFLSVALQLLYWLVPSYSASAVFVTLLGFFL